MHPIPQTARPRVRQPGTVSTTVTHSTAGQVTGQVSNTDHVPAPSAEDVPHPAYVTVRGGVTVNMGNFNSVKCEVAISMPCAPNAEACEQTYADCSAFVEEKLLKERDAAMGVDPEGATYDQQTTVPQ